MDRAPHRPQVAWAILLDAMSGGGDASAAEGASSMSRLYSYSHTQAGIQRLAQQRGLPVLTFDEPKPQRQPMATPVASNVVRFRRPPIAHETRRLPTVSDFSRAKHLEFLATLNIATCTPVKVLIERVAAWHGFTYIDIIKDCRQRKHVIARDDAMCAVFLAYPDTGLPWIGRRFLRDHTTILHALRKRGLK